MTPLLQVYSQGKFASLFTSKAKDNGSSMFTHVSCENVRLPDGAWISKMTRWEPLGSRYSKVDHMIGPCNEVRN